MTPTEFLKIRGRIPEREAKLYWFHHFCGVPVEALAEGFGITPAAVEYRLNRAAERVVLLRAFPTVTSERVRKDLATVFEKVDLDILAGMCDQLNQSEVANILKLTQGRVRHRFFKAVEKLQGAVAAGSSLSEKYKPYEKIFTSISSKNFNILRCVELPQWKDRGIDRCM